LRKRGGLVASAQPPDDAVAHSFERKQPPRLATVHRENVEAEARLHELRAQTDVRAVEEDTLEFRHRIAPAELSEIAAVLAGRAVREFARERAVLFCDRHGAVRTIDNVA
jgi:hypothetical protein